MPTVKFLFVMFTILCVIQSIQVYARRSRQYGVGSWKKSDQKILSYMACNYEDRYRYDVGSFKPVCNFTIEVHDSNSLIERQTCHIDSPAFTNLKNLHYEISALVNSDIAVLYATGRSWAKFQIVHMRECRYRQVYIEVDPLKDDDFGTADVNVTLSEDAFNVFYEDKQECHFGVCRSTYDFSGELLEGPIDSFRPAHNQNEKKVTYVFGEQYGGNVCFTYDYESIKLVLYQEKNASQVLFDLPRQSVTILSISTRRKLFGLCYKRKHNYEATCLQYDNEGREILNKSFSLPRDWTSLRVTNRYEGGFSAMATNCTIKHCNAQRDIYQVEIREKKLKYSPPTGFVPRFCKSRVGDKAEVEIGFDYAMYFNCKPNMLGQSHIFIFKSWCPEFIRCSPVILQ